MRFNVVIATMAAGSAVVSGAPVKREANFGGLFGPLGSLFGSLGMGSGLGNSAQNGVAEAFKAGDTILNIPGDFIRNLMQNPLSAPGKLLGNVFNLAGSLPGDAAKIAGMDGN